MSTDVPLPEPPNESGSTLCSVRWMVTLPNGMWLGAFDREAFDAYGDARAAAATVNLRAAAEMARSALSELLMTRDPIVYSDALRALDAALQEKKP